MKTIQQLSTVGHIKSVRSSGASSIPKAQRPGHLELYVLGMEKGRILKELSALNKRTNTVKGRLEEINGRIKGLQKQVYRQQDDQNSESTSEKPLKTMSIHY